MRLAAILPERGAPRILAASTLVNTIGSGAFVPLSAIYFTRQVGLSPLQVGIGLGVAGFVGIAVSQLAGRLADRSDARRLCIGLMVCEAAAMAAYAYVASFPAFLLVATLVVAGDRSSGAVLGNLVGAAGADGAGRTKISAYLRVMLNVGLTLGAVLSGIALQVDTAAAYRTVILVNAATYALAAVPLLWLRTTGTPAAATRSRRPAAVRDRPYVAVLVVCGLLSLHYDVLVFAMPLWIVQHTAAPRWTVSMLFIVNTILIVVMQVRASRRAESLSAAATLTDRAGLLMLVSWTLLGITGLLPAAAAVTVLVGLVLLHTLAEMWQAAGAFYLSFELAPEGAHGEYQALFAAGRNTVRALAPIFLTFLCLNNDWWGWLIAGALMAVLGRLTPPLVRWAARTRSTTCLERI